MNKKIFIISMFLGIQFFSYQIFAQLQFTQHSVVDRNLTPFGACSVIAIDLDSDGDIDVLFVSQEDSKIAL